MSSLLFGDWLLGKRRADRPRCRRPRDGFDRRDRQKFGRSQSALG
jgi:hypothetical protein